MQWNVGFADRRARPEDSRLFPRAQDRLRERVPGRRAAVAQVPYPRRARHHEEQDRPGQVVREGGAPELIVGDAERLLATGLREELADEVARQLAKQPARSYQQPGIRREMRKVSLAHLLRASVP